jgi:hypothetical protein
MPRECKLGYFFTYVVLSLFKNILPPLITLSETEYLIITIMMGKR